MIRLADRSRDIINRWHHRGQAVDRVALSPRSAWWGEHRSRYHFAARFARGVCVADIACGSGYGTSLLSQAGAAFVVGIEISADALGEREWVSKSGSAACQADAQHLPLATGIFDLVVSFETVEHLKDDALFIKEVHRALKSGGKLILSTPQAFPDRFRNGGPKNCFHVREYTASELRSLLEPFFLEVEILGQRPGGIYPICPLWDSPDAVKRNPVPVRRRLWRIQHRLPTAISDRWSRFFHNRPFYPGEFDFSFRPNDVSEAHVLVAVCQK